MVRRKLNPQSSQSKKRKDKQFYLHLVSDATGTTLLGLARACTAQFAHIDPLQKFWPLIRTERQLQRVLKKISANPGPVVFTMVNPKMRKILQDHCDALHVPSVPVLDPIIHTLSSYLDLNAKGVPGLQHAMDENYFRRVAAVDFAMRFDDGKHPEGLKDADVVLVGVSRTSKTPTSIFLARRGVKCANIPIVPGVAIPEERLTLKKPLYIGLTTSPKRLVQIRRNRLNADGTPNGQTSEAKTTQRNKLLESNSYLDVDHIEGEIRDARRLFNTYHWPVIDVTKRSVEETSAEILALLQSHTDKFAPK